LDKNNQEGKILLMINGLSTTVGSGTILGYTIRFVCQTAVSSSQVCTAYLTPAYATAPTVPASSSTSLIK